MSIAERISAHQLPEAYQIRQGMERWDDNDLPTMINMDNSYKLSMN